jgi:hypothetical protein
VVWATMWENAANLHSSQFASPRTRRASATSRTSTATHGNTTPYGKATRTARSSASMTARCAELAPSPGTTATTSRLSPSPGPPGRPHRSHVAQVEAFVRRPSRHGALVGAGEQGCPTCRPGQGGTVADGRTVACRRHSCRCRPRRGRSRAAWATDCRPWHRLGRWVADHHFGWGRAGSDRDNRRRGRVRPCSARGSCVSM